MSFHRGWKQRRAAAVARREKHQIGSGNYRAIAAEMHARSLKQRFFSDARTFYERLLTEQDALTNQLLRIKSVAAEENRIVSVLHPISLRLAAIPADICIAAAALEPLQAEFDAWMAASDERMAKMQQDHLAEQTLEEQAEEAALKAYDAVMAKTEKVSK